MSGERDDRGASEAADAAARWFVRLQDDAATGDDWLEFEQWLSALPAHAAAYDRLEGVWMDLDDARAELVAAPISLAERRASRGAGLSRRGWLAAGAAVAASVAVGVVGVANWRGGSTDTYATAVGETHQITLADGTHVRLNAGSRIDVRLGRKSRAVQMAEGEAVFDVAHDPARPFFVDTGDREVRVVGTEFNLRQRGANFALTVRRGLVEVRPSQARGATPTRVAAGQRLTHHRGATESVLAAAPPADAFAWTRGQLVYQDAPLSEVAEDLSRSLGARVRPADAAAAQLRFSGVLTLDDRASVVRRLEAFAPIRAEVAGDGIVLHRR
jgi:transmembrane sensor